MKDQPIIVFDSGIGGLSIYRPLKKALPTANIIYISDTVNFPYGDKSVTWLSKRFIELGEQFNSLSPVLVILACNTATTSIIKELRSQLTCPVIGVEPVIKPLAEYNSALALMTPTSANSLATARLLAKYGPHVQVFSPKGLASAIEYNDYDLIKKSIHEIKIFVQKNHIQAIGLSCTHYPLILKELQKEMPSIVFIDPSDAVVRESLRVLKSSDL
jgi:glutamate racemase